MDIKDPVSGARLSRRESLLAIGGAAALLGIGPTMGLAQPRPSPIDWKQISSQFLIDKNLTYLNTSTLGSTPKPVLDARRAVEEKLESNPVGEGFGPLLTAAESVSAKLADLIGCDANEVTVTRNTTEGLNFIVEGINLQPGQHVLTSNSEHGGGSTQHCCARAMRCRNGIHYNGRREAPRAQSWGPWAFPFPPTSAHVRTGSECAELNSTGLRLRYREHETCQ